MEKSIQLISLGIFKELLILSAVCGNDFAANCLLRSRRVSSFKVAVNRGAEGLSYITFGFGTASRGGIRFNYDQTFILNPSIASSLVLRCHVVGLLGKVRWLARSS